MNPVLVCYSYIMSISDITRIVGMLLNGIQSNRPIDPFEHADVFSKLCLLNGFDFLNDTLEGIVFDEDAEQVCFVSWSQEGVNFQQHTYHKDTLGIIRLALHTMQSLEEEEDLEELEEAETELISDEDDTTFEDDWI